MMPAAAQQAYTRLQLSGDQQSPTASSVDNVSVAGFIDMLRDNDGDESSTHATTQPSKGLDYQCKACSSPRNRCTVWSAFWGTLLFAWFAAGFGIVLERAVGGVPLIEKIPWHIFGWSHAPWTAGFAMIAGSIMSFSALIWPDCTSLVAGGVLEFFNLAEVIFAVLLQSESFSAFEVFTVFVFEPWIMELLGASITVGVSYYYEDDERHHRCWNYDGSARAGEIVNMKETAKAVSRMFFGMVSESAQCYLYMRYSGCFLSPLVLDLSNSGSFSANTTEEYVEYDYLDMPKETLAARLFPAFAGFQILAIAVQFCGETSTAAKQHARENEQIIQTMAQDIALIAQKQSEADIDTYVERSLAAAELEAEKSLGPTFLGVTIFGKTRDQAEAERRHIERGIREEAARDRRAAADRARKHQEEICTEALDSDDAKDVSVSGALYGVLREIRNQAPEVLMGLCFTLLSPDSPFRAQWFDLANGCYCFFAGIALHTNTFVERRDKLLDTHFTDIRLRTAYLERNRRPVRELHARVHRRFVFPVAVVCVIVTWFQYYPTVLRRWGDPMFDTQLAVLTTVALVFLPFVWLAENAHKRRMEQLGEIQSCGQGCEECLLHLECICTIAVGLLGFLLTFIVADVIVMIWVWNPGGYGPVLGIVALIGVCSCCIKILCMHRAAG